MTQQIYTAVITKSSDYRDNDKLLRLFTLEGGIITAVMKGVKKAGAKLKFGAQPFAFCEYSLVCKGGFNVITGCVQIEDLFALTQDYDVFKYCSVILEVSDAAASGQASPEMFVRLLKSYRDILYRAADPGRECASFIYQTLFECGFIDKSYLSINSDSIEKQIKKLVSKMESCFHTVILSAKLV